MSKKKELFLEEAVLDDLADEFEYLEQPLSERAFKLVVFLISAIILISGFQIFYIGILNKDFYNNRSLLNSGQITIINSPRGIIYDRFDKPLVKNIPNFKLSLRLVELLKTEENKQKTIKVVSKILNLPDGYLESLIENVNLEKQNSLTISKELTPEDVKKLKDLNLPVIQIEENYKRQYLYPEIISHVLGYAGPVTKEDIKNNEDYLLNEIIGKTGLEAYYNKEIKGEDGQVINYKNAKGELIDTKLLKNAQPGGDLYLTIDSEFQEYFYKRLKEGIAINGERGGVGIALNPKNGEVLALVNLPSFDNNKITSGNLIDPYKPLFDRAISGVYTPGSTIKPLVAVAALKEKIITPEKQIFSAGYIEIPNPYNPDQPSRFLDWKSHGWVDLHSAIARSSNVYFYTVGGGFEDIKGLGVEKLKEYWKKFGLGEKTGIDLPGEDSGSLADPIEKEKRGGGVWRIGDTYNVSIGQGDLLVTPIQLINYIAGIANDGEIHRPFVVKKVISQEQIKENQSKVIYKYVDEEGYIKEVQEGMKDTVSKSYGTGYSLNDLLLRVAAKTGTSQIENKSKINTFFVGYAPADGPQIAILVLIENAREGSVSTVPVAKDVFRWYYENRMSDSE